MSDLADKMQEAVEQYILRFNAQDYEGVAALYAEDATVEDPVGSELKNGRPAILEFYQSAISGQTQLELTGPVRLAGREAAFPFQANVKTDNGTMTIQIIDVFAFNDAGEVTSMRAFWGERNLIMG